MYLFGKNNPKNLNPLKVFLFLVKIQDNRKTFFTYSYLFVLDLTNLPFFCQAEKGDSFSNFHLFDHRLPPTNYII
jgi:hypothetical protein